MPVEEFVAGWISGETFFFFLSITPKRGLLPGEAGLSRGVVSLWSTQQLAVPRAFWEWPRRQRGKKARRDYLCIPRPCCQRTLRACQGTSPKPLLQTRVSAPTTFTFDLTAVLTSPLETCLTWQWLALLGLEKGHHKHSPGDAPCPQAPEAAFSVEKRLDRGWLSPLGPRRTLRRAPSSALITVTGKKRGQQGLFSFKAAALSKEGRSALDR